MSSTHTQTEVEQLNRRLEALSDLATEEHLEALREKRDELLGEADSDDPDPTETDVDVVEALSNVSEETLSDPDAIDAEIDSREKKLEALGVILPDDRVDEVHDELEALQAAKEVTNPYRTNTPEALAARIEVQQR